MRAFHEELNKKLNQPLYTPFKSSMPTVGELSKFESSKIRVVIFKKVLLLKSAVIMLKLKNFKSLDLSKLPSFSLPVFITNLASRVLRLLFRTEAPLDPVAKVRNHTFIMRPALPMAPITDDSARGRRSDLHLNSMTFTLYKSINDTIPWKICSKSTILITANPRLA